MRTRLERLGALAVVLTLLGGGALGFGVQRAAAAPASAVQVQQQVDDGSETAGEVENGAEVENGETGGDELIDGIKCVQQGENEGENVGC